MSYAFGKPPLRLMPLNVRNFSLMAEMIRASSTHGSIFDGSISAEAPFPLSAFM